MAPRRKTRLASTLDDDDAVPNKVVAMLSSSSSSLLQRFVEHTSLDFHSIPEDEATEIRNALLHWYRSERRKLPWRGDPPPWQGSTAKGAAASTAKKNSPTTKSKTQKQVTDYFATNKKTNPPDTKTNNHDKNLTTTHREEASSSTLLFFPVTAYGVWVSEIMLQQTRVEAVIPFWIRWMQSFPTVHELAAATEDQVNAHWAGLGFYRRARLLHSAAKQVVEKHNGILPGTVEGLLELPGIGRYTASAVASIAHNVAVPVVDGNVCRVLSRLRGIAQHVKAPALKDQHAWTLAASIVGTDGSTAGEVNQALMELGATYCAPSGTGVEEGDPLKDFYWSTKLAQEAADVGDGRLDDLLDQVPQASEAHSMCPVCTDGGVTTVLEELAAGLQEVNPTGDPRTQGHRVLPLAPPKAAKREEVLAVGVFLRHCPQGKPLWLMVRRPKTGLLAGQWEFPSACVWNSADLPKTKKKEAVVVPNVSTKQRRLALDALLSELNATSTVRSRSVETEPLEHIFSHVRHTMWIEHGNINEGELLMDDEWTSSNGRQVRWMSEVDMQNVGITSGVKKILRKVRGKQTKQPPKAKRAKRG